MAIETQNGSERDDHPGQITTDRTGRSGGVGAGYEIRVKDHLEQHWFAWFEGWTITNLENGEVLLNSSRVDQSALHGTLNKIRDLNLTLISVSQILRENR